MVRVMKTSFKRTYARTPGLLYSVTLTLQQATVGPLETPRHSQASLTQSLVGTVFLLPGFWFTQDFVCALQESVSSVLWKFYNQITLALKDKLSGGSQSFARSQGWEI